MHFCSSWTPGASPSRWETQGKWEQKREYSKTSIASISAWAGKVFLIEEMMPGRQYLLSTESTGLPRTKRQRKNKFCLSPLEMSIFSCPWTSELPGLGLSNPDQNIRCQPQSPRPSDSDHIAPLAFLSLQPAEGGWQDFSASITA